MRVRYLKCDHGFWRFTPPEVLPDEMSEVL